MTACMMMKCPNAVIYDFDGVLCDSVGECLVVSYRAYRSLHNAGAPSRECPNDYLRERFCAYRPLVRTPREYFLLWQLIERDVPIKNDVLIREQQPADRDTLDQYHEAFFRSRREWRDTDNEGWLDTNPLYDGIVEGLQAVQANNCQYIVSAKDASAIHAILAWHGIAWDRKKILGAEMLVDKDVLLERVVKESRVTAQECYFLDDNLTNLSMAATQGMQVMLATWGYIFPHAQAVATAQGFATLALNDFGTWTKATLSSF